MTNFAPSILNLNASSVPEVIVEIGINHGGSLDVAKRMAALAISQGARLIKHQTHIPDAEMSLEARKIKPGNSNLSIYEVIASATLDEHEELELMEFVVENGGIFFSSPFSREAADRLESWGVPLYKIGSGECNNFPLVSHIAQFGKPVILSTGMNSIESVRKTVAILEGGGCQVALMHTTNLYPTPTGKVRLGGVSHLAREFPRNLVGLSDHSLTNAPALGAVALGAKLLERHFTDDKSRKGPDIVCSMDPAELGELIRLSRELHLALGGSREPLKEEVVTMNFAFASCVTIAPIKKGELFSQQNLWVKRPSGGAFSAEQYLSLLGATCQMDLPENVQVPRAAVSDEVR